MSTATTAQELLDDLQKLPKAERTKFLVLLGNQAFQDDNLTHEQVFGHLASEAFTAQEAAEYLEMSVSNFRRYVQAEKIKPVQIVGRNQLFATRELKALKRALKAAA